MSDTAPMGAITIRRRRDKPTEDGRYVAIVKHTGTLVIAVWSERDSRWMYQGRRIEVSGWEGPVLVPAQDALW